MPKDPNRFTEKTKTLLAKRAGYRCSNSYCRSPTSGPHVEENRSISIGEAAHIRGANSGSARYDKFMTAEERSVVTNAIWLCRSCAKLIDTDERRYSVDILYKWKSENEDGIFSEIEGSIEDKINRNTLKLLYENEPLSALQIAIDKPDCWEYLLAIELLRYKFKEIKVRFSRLERGLEYKPSKAIYGHDFFCWFQARIHDLSSIVKLFCVIISDELMDSFGESGVAGDPISILEASNLIESGCHELIEWEREIKYTIFPGEFEDIQSSLLGWSFGFIDEMDRIHIELAKIFEHNLSLKGSYAINLVFELPDNFENITNDAVQRMEYYLT